MVSVPHWPALPAEASSILGFGGDGPRSGGGQLAPARNTHNVKLQENEDRRHGAVSLGGKTLEVVSIDERREEEAERWEPEPVYKVHCQVTLEPGRSYAYSGT